MRDKQQKRLKLVATMGAVMQEVIVNNTAAKAAECINLLETDGNKDVVNIVLQRNTINKTTEDAKYLSIVKTIQKATVNRTAVKAANYINLMDILQEKGDDLSMSAFLDLVDLLLSFIVISLHVQT